ncbi:MAG: hypothetical protein ACI9CD_001136 [Candidatus Deianiraeaceae bacterium]|jgi:uncharacterized protein (TIGR02186 family)
MIRVLFLGIMICNISFARSFFIDKNEIKINLLFQGDTIHLYGTQPKKGKVVVILKGERESYFIQKKRRVFGMWIKGTKKHFDDVYRYYNITADTHLSKLQIPYLLKPFEIGIENISTYYNSVADAIEGFEYKNSLLRKKINNNLFVEKYHILTKNPHNLLYVKFDIPNNIPEGRYIVSIYVISKGSIHSVNNIPLYIHQVGLLKFITSLASERKILYSFLSITLSIGIALFGYIILSGKVITYPKRIILQTVMALFNKKNRSTKRGRGRPRKNKDINKN